MQSEGRRDGLGVIFAFFLGLLVTAFFGVGVYTFYPMPQPYQQEIDELYRREQEVRRSRPMNELSEEERQLLDAIFEERRELYEAQSVVQRRWSRNTSMIMIALATATMAFSLTRSYALPVISNGLLLGGLFTMLYGVGWIFTSDTALLRFLVIALALAITLVMGYVRFVKQQKVTRPTARGAVRSGESADLAAVERRLDEIERRLDHAARALTNKR